MRERMVTVMLVALGLVGCSSHQQQAQNECQSLGLVPGTPPYADCYLRVMDRRTHSGDAAIGAGLGLYGISSQPRGGASSASCTQFGNTVTCSGVR